MTALIQPLVDASMKRAAGVDLQSSQPTAAGVPTSSFLYNMAYNCERIGLHWPYNAWPKFAVSQLYANTATVPQLVPHLISAFGRYPAAAEKVREEADRVYRTHGEVLTWQALQECDYGNRFVKEVVRLGPVIQYVSRQALKDLNVDG